MTVTEMRDLLVKAGLVEDEDFEVSYSHDTAIFSLKAEVPLEELPEALKPHAPSWSELERAMWKGYAGEKQSTNGARFHLALQEYLSGEFHAIPEVAALEETLPGLKSLEEFHTYQAKRASLWRKMFEDRADLRELEEKLEKLP